MAISFSDLKLFFSKQAKHGSIILAAIIPIVIVLSEFDLIGKDFLKAINQFITIIGVGIVVFRIALDEYERAKVKNKDINAKIDEGNFSKAKDMISDNLSDITKVSVDIAKDVIETIKKPKEIVIVHNTGNLTGNIPEYSEENKDLIESLKAKPSESTKKPKFAVI